MLKVCPPTLYRSSFDALWIGPSQVMQDLVKDTFEGKSRGEVECDLGLQFNHFCPHLQNTVLQCVKLGFRPRGFLQAFFCKRMKEHISGTVQKQPEVIRLKVLTGGAIGV